MDNLTNMSRKLSWALRHGLDELKLPYDNAGFVKATDLLNHSQFSNYDINIIKEIAENDKKNRFSIKNVGNIMLIRANQGHNINVGDNIKNDKLLKLITQPLSNIYHGSYKQHIKSISENGLSRMSRKHIHMSKLKDFEAKKLSDSDLIIMIDMPEAIKDGIQFYESENGVILTEGINGTLPPKYLTFIKN